MGVVNLTPERTDTLHWARLFRNDPESLILRHPMGVSESDTPIVRLPVLTLHRAGQSGCEHGVNVSSVTLSSPDRQLAAGLDLTNEAQIVGIARHASLIKAQQTKSPVGHEYLTGYRDSHLSEPRP